MNRAVSPRIGSRSEGREIYVLVSRAITDRNSLVGRDSATLHLASIVARSSKVIVAGTVIRCPRMCGFAGDILG